MNIVDWAVETMDRFGSLGVALLIFLENVFPPIPSEVILPLAGVAAAGPNNTYAGMLIASIIGSVTGAWLLYGLGRLLGPERLRWAFIHLPLLNVDDFDKTVQWMEKHGHKGVFFGRMVPGVRSLISIPAGLYKMPFLMFTLLTTLGSAIWNTIFVTFGYTLGSNWTVIEPYTDVISKAVYVIIAIAIVWTLIKLIRREKRRKEKGLPDPDQEHKDELAKQDEQGEHGEHGEQGGTDGRHDVDRPDQPQQHAEGGSHRAGDDAR